MYGKINRGQVSRPLYRACPLFGGSVIRGFTVVFSKPVHALRVGGGPSGANHGLFKAKPSSHHVHSTLQVTPPTSLYPTFLLTQNQRASTQRLSFLCSAQCDVTKSAL